MSAKFRITTNRQEIKSWVEKYSGQPELIGDPQAGSRPLGLRVDFPGKQGDQYLGESQQPKAIAWELFFHIFEKKELAFVYDTQPKTKDLSFAYRFIHRDSIQEEMREMESFDSQYKNHR